jgi:HPr kinase/phosphorylase
MRNQASVQVGRLLDGESNLELGLLSDWGGLDRVITRPRIQKPGLALAGFVKHVYPDRIQVLGLTEIDYLLTISEAAARAGLESFLARNVCGLVLTRGLEPPELLMELAREHGVAVLRTPLLSSTFITRVTRRLEELLSPTASIHGVLVDVLGVGLLLIGRSGVGKSEAALDLVLKGHRLVADDVVEVTVRPPDTVWGAATELHQHHMEIRGMGILNITHPSVWRPCATTRRSRSSSSSRRPTRVTTTGSARSCRCGRSSRSTFRSCGFRCARGATSPRSSRWWRATSSSSTVDTTRLGSSRRR